MSRIKKKRPAAGKTGRPRSRPIPAAGRGKSRVKNGGDENILTGKIEGHPEGYAFFIPDGKKGEDLFIHRKNLNGALHGDRVEVKAGVFRGRKEAAVVRITERGVKSFVGVADIDRRRFDVIPLSRNFTSVMRVTEDGFDCSDGDAVICRVERYPSEKIFGTASVSGRLGPLDEPGVDNKIVMYKYGLSENFPSEAAREALDIESGASFCGGKAPSDFRELFAVTIDGESARDYDDAVSVTEEDGRIALYVHIADVSRFVRKGSPIDREAERRGTSVYFPQFAVPMLPEALSNGLCSLLPGEDRYTVTAKIIFSEKGEKLSASFYRSVIKSRFRLTYGYVNDVLSGKAEPLTPELSGFLIRAERLASILLKNRQYAGGLDFDLPEAVFLFGGDGRVEDIRPAERGRAERMIELFMIAANEAAACLLEERKIPSLYRTHGEPDIKKLENWLETAKSFGLNVPPPEFPVTPGFVRELGIASSGSEYAFILNPMLVRCMMRAEYTADNTGHFGLASTAYTHFTSPIRRYPDLLVHRALLHGLGLGEDHETEEELSRLAPAMSRLERLADEAENEIGLFKKMEYLKNHRDETFTAYINRISPDGLFIFVEKLMMTGFIDFASIPGDRFYVCDDGLSASSRRAGEVFRVGGRVSVTLLEASLILLRADFRLAGAKKRGRKKHVL